MIPKKGDLTFIAADKGDKTCCGLFFYLKDWSTEAIDERLATPDDLRGMGLVTTAEYDKLETRYLDLVTEVEKLQEFAYKQEDKQPKTAKEPQHTREFQEGDKVRILVGSYKNKEGKLEAPSQPEWGWKVRLGVNAFIHCQAADLELISAEPEIPDWIAEGKWVEFDGRKFLVREWDEFWIRCVKRVFTDGVDKGGSEYLSDVIKHGEPFTPPPMPELPEVFSYDETNPCLLKHKQGTTMPLEAWIAAIQAKKEYWFEETLTKLLAIQAHIEKWGME